jgi:tetratricopeptide (TPR) repeat protein
VLVRLEEHSGSYNPIELAHIIHPSGLWKSRAVRGPLELPNGGRMTKEKHSPNGSVAASPWIYSPWLDLIVGCGAWSAPLLLISYFAVAANTRTWSITFYALALLFNYPHFMATIYRAYHRAEDFHKYRIFTVHITALVVLTLILSHAWIRILPWIFTIYLTWSPWHYSGQNYGLFMMFARRAGANPSEGTRRMLYGAFITSYLILFLGFHAGASADPLFISLGIPPIVSRWEQAILAVAFFVLSASGLSRLAHEIGWRKLIPSLTLFSSQFLWFLLPAGISLMKGLDIPQSRYSTGVLAVMHSTQYLWITSYYARRETAGENARNWRPWAYFAVVIVGGIALFVPGPWLASRVFHHDFTTSFLIFTALVNIHHFILDGAIWKLRDGRIAALLLNSRERISSAASQAGNGLSQVWSWLAGETAGARRLRVSAAVLLLLWGTIDQARYYLALHADNLKDLQRAAALNSFDSPLQTRIGRRELEEGQAQSAEAAWRSAIQANPANPAPRQALLHLMVDQKRFDEALNLTEASLKYAPNDASLLVDHGLLSLHKGKPDVAIADWNKALAIDSTQSTVHLYLAYEFDHEGKPREAASHYASFINAIAHQPARNRPEPDKLIAVVLRMADCQMRAAQPDLAVKSYRMAEQLAAQTKQGKLESVADVNEAALQAKSGRLSEALQLYQRALNLDESIGDTRSAAEDWASYGRFLAEAGFPSRLAYACFVKSERLAALAQNAPSADLLAGDKKTIEKQIGPEAAALRRNPEPALQQALALRR